MKTFFYRITIVLFLFSILFSCNCIEDDGAIIKKTKLLSDFSGVKVSVPAHVDIIKADSNYFTVETSKNVLRHLVFRLDNGLFEIMADRCLCDSKLKINIYAEELDKVYVDGAAMVTSDFSFPNSDIFDIQIEGDAFLDLNIDAKKVVISDQGSGTLMLKGFAKEVKLDSFGGSVIHTFGLRSDLIGINSEGSGNYYVDSTQQMNVCLAGNSSVYYRGDPNIHSQIEGNAIIQKME